MGNKCSFKSSTFEFQPIDTFYFLFFLYAQNGTVVVYYFKLMTQAFSLVHSVRSFLQYLVHNNENITRPIY